MPLSLAIEQFLPADGTAGTLIARVWMPGPVPGPTVALLKGDGVYDIGRSASTVAALLATGDPLARVRSIHHPPRIGSIAAILANTPEEARDSGAPWFLAPVDLQAVKACGVTFVKSLLERVIEERAHGDPAAAQEIRRTVVAEVGVDLRAVQPSSPAAERLKQAMMRRGLWSHYLEVGIGPDAEVFTKAQPMASVGTGADIGVRTESMWNNPEPEVVLIVEPGGRLVGATLGNDVNLRDFEGRSTLLLGQAKDNNRSCAIGPVIRLLDQTFTIDHVRQAEVDLTVAGPDGFALAETSSMKEISRDILDLVAQTINPNHQYPDGLALFTGTMFAPVQDREGPGMGFTHRSGDLVTIASPMLGALVNRVGRCDRLGPWTFGVRALMENLAARGLLGAG